MALDIHPPKVLRSAIIGCLYSSVAVKLHEVPSETHTDINDQILLVFMSKSTCLHCTHSLTLVTHRALTCVCPNVVIGVELFVTLSVVIY